MARGSGADPASGEELTARLVDAALQVLNEHGLGELTVRRVAEAAGSSTMGVYSRFGGRAGVLEALYRRVYAQMADAMAAVPSSSDPVADIVALALAYRAFALEGPQRYAFMFADPLPDFAPGAGLRAEMVQAAFGPLLDAVRRAGATGAEKADGAPSANQMATRASYCLWCVMHGLVGLELTDVLRAPLTAWGITGEDDAAAERMYHAGVHAMIAGLELRASG